MMRWIIIACLTIILVAFLCVPAVMAEDFPDYSKIVQINLHYQGDSYAVSSLEVTYGKAPNLNLRSGNLQGSILDSGGNELKSFSLRQRGVAYGDILGSPGEDSLIGYTESAASGEMTIKIPYIQDMQEFTLTDTRDGLRLISVDLREPVATFCSDYSQDPECLVRTTASRSVTPDTGKPFVLATVFSVSVLLTAGIALFMMLRRTPVPQVPQKQTVLIVDDEPDIVGLIDLSLRRRGMNTIQASSGQECLDVLKKQVPDVILLDIMMEPMSGWDTLEKIKKTPEYREIPVLMLTGKTLTTQEAKKYHICIHDYIMKPFRIDELYTAVDQVLERRQKLRESLSLIKQAGIEPDKFCELVTLSRHTYVNRKIVDILNVPQPVPMAADLATLDDMLVIDYLKVKASLNEKRVAELQQEINAAFRSKGFPEFSWG